jgi:hypothetical protein
MLLYSKEHTFPKLFLYCSWQRSGSIPGPLTTRPPGWRWHTALMMEAVRTSETSVNFYQTTRRNISGDFLLAAVRTKNLTNCNIVFTFHVEKFSSTYIFFFAFLILWFQMQNKAHRYWPFHFPRGKVFLVIFHFPVNFRFYDFRCWRKQKVINFCSNTNLILRMSYDLWATECDMRMAQTSAVLSDNFSSLQSKMTLIYIYKTLRYVSVQGSAVSWLQERNRTY